MIYSCAHFILTKELVFFTIKLSIIQFLIDEPAKEEEDILQPINLECQHSLWNQHNAFDAAKKLQKFLESDKA